MTARRRLSLRDLGLPEPEPLAPDADPALVHALVGSLPYSTIPEEWDARLVLDFLDDWNAEHGIVRVDTRSDETVDRVARALHAAEHCGHPDEFTEVDARCYADARAVLAALASPEPTKESR